MSNSSSLFKNSLLNFNRNILAMVLGVVSSIIIARFLGPEKQGIYTLVILLPNMLVTCLNLGISSANVYYIGQKKYSLETIVSNNIVLVIMISIISILLGLMAVFFLKSTFFKDVPAIYLFVILSAVPLLFLSSFLQSISQGLQDYKTYNFVAILNSITTIVFLFITVLLIKLNLAGAFISFIASVLIPDILLIHYFKKKVPLFKKGSISKEFIMDSFVYGYKAHLSNILAFVNYRADILIISHFLTPAAVGIYNVAVSIAEKLWVISQPVSTVLFPMVSSASSREERNRLTTMVARNVLLLSIVVGAFIYILCNVVILIMFGKAYQPAATIIKILLVGITLFSAERILSNDLAGRGKPELNLYTSLVTVVTNIVLSIIFVQKWGFYGSALATSISYSLTFFVKLIIFCNEAKVSYLSVIFLNKEDFNLYKSIFLTLKKE